MNQNTEKATVNAKEEVLKLYPLAFCVHSFSSWSIFLEPNEPPFVTTLHSEDVSWRYALLYINNLKLIK